MEFLQSCEIAALAASIFLSGTITSVSMLAIPVALETATDNTGLLKQWRAIYRNGHIKGPVLATTIAAALAMIAACKYKNGVEPNSTIIAAALTAGIVPYTWVVMGGVNRRLHSVAAENGLGDVDVRRAVGVWSRMNAVRGLLPLVGGVVGLWGVLGR